MNGSKFLAAVKYALLACPKGSDANDALSHMVFHRGRVVAGDGWRFHLAALPEGWNDHPPVAATRRSCVMLAKMMAAAEAATAAEGQFEIEMDGAEVKVTYGEGYSFERTLEGAVVGAVPGDWEPPVSANAPAGMPPVLIAAKWINAATRWPGATAEWRSEKNMARVDLRAGDNELVATAVILPIGNHATLPEDKQRELFRAEHKGRDMGMSILSLAIDDITSAEERLASAGDTSDLEPPSMTVKKAMLGLCSDDPKMSVSISAGGKTVTLPSKQELTARIAEEEKKIAKGKRKATTGTKR